MVLTEQQEKRLDQMRENFLAAKVYLLNYVAELCPGPHVLKQHRDRKPPWCNACGRDELGHQRRESDG